MVIVFSFCSDCQKMSSIVTCLDDQVAVDHIECLNMDPDCDVKDLFSTKADAVVRSDIDPQMLVTIHFKVPVRLSGIKLTYSDLANPESVPESIKLFANRVSMGFSDAESLPALQTITHREVASGETVPLKVALFQNVVSLQLFVDCNKGGVDKSELGRISVFGMLGERMEMRDFKKIKDDE